MGTSGTRGSFGVAIQSAVDAPAEIPPSGYFPVNSSSMTNEQMAQPLPPEVGGTLFGRGAYKGGFRVRGETAFVPRVNTIGLLLRSLFNGETVIENSAADDVSTGSPTVYKHDHLFTVRDDLDPMWLTVRRYVGGTIGEEMSDARVGSFRLDVAATNVVNATAQLLARGWRQIPPTPVPPAIDGDFFLSCVSQVYEDRGDDTTTIVPPWGRGDGPNPGETLPTSMVVDRASVELGIQLTDNEFRIGAYALDDITALQRQAGVTMDVRLSRDDLFRKVYRNGKSSLYTDPTPVAASGDVSVTHALDIRNPTMETQVRVRRTNGAVVVPTISNETPNTVTVTAAADDVGGTIEVFNGSWEPAIYRGSMYLWLLTENAGTAGPSMQEGGVDLTEGDPYGLRDQIRIEIPGIDFLAMPLSMQGGELVRAQLSASITLDSDNWVAHDSVLQPIRVTLRNDHSVAYG